MLKPKNVLEVKVEDRIYQFICAIDAPIGEIHDALCKMKGFVVQHIAASNEAEKKAKEEMNGNAKPESAPCAN
jgi:hypothetical protein